MAGSPFNGNGIARVMYQGLQSDYAAPPTEMSPRLIQDINAEEAVVAAILLDDREVVAEGVTSLLTPEMLVDGPCRAAYRAYLSLREQGMETTIITVLYEWSERGWIDAVDQETGGLGAEVWLAGVVGKYFTAVGVISHARIIRDLWERRTQFSQAQEMARKAFEGPVIRPIYERPEYMAVGADV
jgi:replicative DNA helicase